MSGGRFLVGVDPRHDAVPQGAWCQAVDKAQNAERPWEDTFPLIARNGGHDVACGAGWGDQKRTRSDDSLAHGGVHEAGRDKGDAHIERGKGDAC